MPVYDAHTALAVLQIAVIGGIIGLDRTAVGQFMISQPIVAAPLAGWVLGDTTSGMIIGAVLELIWVLDIPLGKFVPADSTIGAVSATAITVLGHPAGASLPVIGFSIILTTAMVPVTMTAEGLVRSWNSRMTDRVLASSGGSRGRALARAQLSGVALFFLKSFVLYVIFIPLGIAALGLFGLLPVTVQRALALFVTLLPLLGAAFVVRKLSVRTFELFVFAGFAIAAIFGQALQVPVLAVLLLTAAAGWLGATYRERRP